MFILDTDHLGFVQRKGSAEHAARASRMRQHPLESFYVTIVSFHEQAIGWNSYIQRARTDEGIVRGYAMFDSLLSDFARMNVLPFDTAAATVFSKLRKAGVRVGTMDLRFAAIALVKGYTVLTRNAVDFERIAELHVEDWTMPATQDGP